MKNSINIYFSVTKINYIGSKNKISNVELPDTVVEIGDYSFSNWYSLKSIKLSHSYAKAVSIYM